MMSLSRQSCQIQTTGKYTSARLNCADLPSTGVAGVSAVLRALMLRAMDGGSYSVKVLHSLARELSFTHHVRLHSTTTRNGS